MCCAQAGVESSPWGREGLHLFDADQSDAIESRELEAAMHSLGFEVKNEELKGMLSDGKELFGMRSRSSLA